jgi:pyruvate kinase
MNDEQGRPVVAEQQPRKTKIVCTIGPKTASFEAIRQLAEQGMNVARLNMSHGTQEWHRGVIGHIKRYNKKYAGSLAIMLDTRGAEVRSGDLKQDLFLRVGDILTLTTRRQAELAPYWVEVSHDGFVAEVALGDIILVDGGMLRLEVKEITRTDVRCQSLDEGVLSSRRHLNIRGKSADLPAITEQDWRDIDFGIEERIDFIALSFVRAAAPILDLQHYLDQQGVAVEVLAKIESAASIPELDSIIAAADGIMIARGDLGAEMPYEEVPLLQAEIVRKCRRSGKPVVVATHMLESMIVNPTPTRAEVTDITHAVQQGVDAIMLSGETATGRYPFKALEVMDVVARRIERHQQLQAFDPARDGACEPGMVGPTQKENISRRWPDPLIRRQFLLSPRARLLPLPRAGGWPRWPTRPLSPGPCRWRPGPAPRWKFPAVPLFLATTWQRPGFWSSPAGA